MQTFLDEWLFLNIKSRKCFLEQQIFMWHECSDDGAISIHVHLTDCLSDMGSIACRSLPARKVQKLLGTVDPGNCPHNRGRQLDGFPHQIVLRRYMHDSHYVERECVKRV